MNLYLKSGYLNTEDIIMRTPYPFIFIWGGRGTGKTYGSLKTMYEYDKRFFYFRRTQRQADIISTPQQNPFNKLNKDQGWNVEIKSAGQGIYLFQEDEKILGQIGALSTFANFRSVEASDITHVIYDEFMPEKHQQKIRQEGEALLNLYETINRNRELGDVPEDPVKLILLSNANDIGNPIFMELGLVNIAARMQERKQLYYINRDRGLLLINMDNSPISAQKRKTALGKLLEGTDSEFGSMAYDNAFVDDSIAVIRSRNLRGYVPLVTVAGVTIYKHKSNGLYYATEHSSGSPEVFSTAEASIEKFRKKYWYLWACYLDNDIEFENKLCSVIFEKLW